ncbi:MAG: sulfite exporter TauE/SafE family protein [Aestuariivita sp.]|nr:sulfite exporter TauE/SafE family protein [Aestuariivita sp.]
MPEMILLLYMFILLLLIGAVAGILAGLLGVGGGVVLVAAFFYAFQTLGYDSPQLMQICLATSLTTIIVTSVRSVMGHHKNGAVDWKILQKWAPGIVIGAIGGVMIVATLTSQNLQIIFGILAFLVGLYMGFGKHYWRLGDNMPTGVFRVILSPIVGFLSVLMGIGGGSFGVPLMTLYGQTMHKAVATSAGFGVIIAVPSVMAFLLMPIDTQSRPPFNIGAVNLVAFVVVIMMTLLTTPLGVRMAHAIDPVPLRKIFAIFLVIVALNILRQAFS